MVFFGDLMLFTVNDSRRSMFFTERARNKLSEY